MTRLFAATLILALILAACSPQAAATPAPAAQPTSAPAAPQPTQAPALQPPPGAIQPPTLRASPVPPELRPPASGGQLNPPTVAPTISLRPIAGVTSWQTYRDNNLGLSFQYPSDWSQSLGQDPQLVRRVSVSRLRQPTGNNAQIMLEVRQRQGELLAWLNRQLPTNVLLINATGLEGGTDSYRRFNASLSGTAAVFLYRPARGSTADTAALFVVDNQYIYQFTYIGDTPDNRNNRAVFLRLLNTTTLSGTASSGVSLPRTTFTTGVITP